MLQDVAAPPPPARPDGAPAPLPEKKHLREMAVRVIARLNIELRKCGERGLDPMTINRLQYLLQEELEQRTPKVDNSDA